MFTVPTAVGYLRSDHSGTRQDWHEIQIRSLAKRLGYNLRKTIVFGTHTDQPLPRLIQVVSALDAEAVIVPNLDHLGGSVPVELVRVTDVVIVEPERTYACWGTGELPDGSDTM